MIIKKQGDKILIRNDDVFDLKEFVKLYNYIKTSKDVKEKQVNNNKKQIELLTKQINELDKQLQVFEKFIKNNNINVDEVMKDE
ncbi:MAG: hypothetical protein DRG78_20705 [Epsilonproteobacteria bacterium]|nr:MAG: hypothetical protein DRG78_20705 [Campylobacterota bacterium]